MLENWYSILQSVLNPALMPLDPSRRIYFLFIISSLLIASIYFLIYKKQPLKEAAKDYFVSPYQGHAASLFTDIKIVLTNGVIKTLLITPLMVGQLSLVVFFAAGYRQLGMLPITMDISYSNIAFIYTASLFLIGDFSRFLLHYLMHKIPLLWEFHKTHHSATALTPLTLYRIHPVEVVLANVRGALALGLCGGLFVVLFPGKISVIEILGVNAAMFIFNLLGANLRHSHIPLHFGQLENLVVSPAMHQLHHSNHREHHDRNFGSCFSIWDRLFRSYLPAHPHTDVLPSLTFGCHNGGKQTLGGQLITPFLNAWTRIIKLTSFKESNKHDPQRT